MNLFEKKNQQPNKPNRFSATQNNLIDENFENVQIIVVYAGYIITGGYDYAN